MFNENLSFEDLMKKTNELINATKIEIEEDPLNQSLKIRLKELEQMKDDAIKSETIFKTMMKNNNLKIYDWTDMIDKAKN